ncbi:MAG: S41 family peptidase [Candidatus Omnitrophica bacterium]|nr:S41 family peptidase [Candidatus Omnitrophota bacterium]
MKRFRVIVFAAVLVVLAASIAISGHEKEAQGKDKAKVSKSDLYTQLELFADAISLVRANYVDEVDPKKIIYGAMRGMLASLDDYSQFMDPEEYEEIRTETKGEFGGIGTEISIRDGILTIITPIAGTPAEEAGIKPGDKVVKINGKITKNITLSDAAKQMRGKPGSMVTLTIWREKDQKIMNVPIKRAVIKIRSVKRAELVDGKTGYIRLVEFQDTTKRELEEALKKLESQGMDALILDLRYNPGGVLEAAIDVAEKFLPKDKVIVSIKAREPEQNAVFKSSGRYTHPDHPLIILVNEGSASAAEIVAGATQDNKRGIVLGAKTYGKASVQTVVPLRDGSAVRLTTAAYLTPSGKLIKDSGILPDVAVELKETAGDMAGSPEEVFEKVAEGKSGKKDAPGKDKLEMDNQLEAAVNLMKAIKVYSKEKV